MLETLEPALDHARARLCALVGADPADLVFVTNATMGVNTVVRSLSFEPGDELLTIDHVYNACRNALDYAAAKVGSEGGDRRRFRFPSIRPKRGRGLACLSAVTDRTRFVLIDHVTSPTGLVLPIARHRRSPRGAEE